MNFFCVECCYIKLNFYLCQNKTSITKKTEIMNYRIKLENVGCEIKKTFTFCKNKIRNISYTITFNGKSYSFKTLKEAYNLIDLF